MRGLAGFTIVNNPEIFDQAAAPPDIRSFIDNARPLNELPRHQQLAVLKRELNRGTVALTA
jgi:hypothetical protein